MLRLKHFRKQKGINQETLAAFLGVTQATLSGWENEKYEIDNKSLLKCADYFNVSVDTLLGRTNEADLLYKTAEEKYYLDKFSALTIEQQKHFFEGALSEQEQHLITGFRSLSTQGQEYILDTINLAMFKYAIPDESTLRIAAAPDITPAKIDIDSDDVKHS